MRIQLLIALLVLGACAPLVPATTPPQLEHTPGAFVIVTDSTFDAGRFIVDYPSSWRVVKSSIAEAEFVQVVFVAPDESTVTLTELANLPDTPSDDEQFITLDNDVVVQVIVGLSDDVGAHFDDLAEQLIASIRSSN